MSLTSKTNYFDERWRSLDPAQAKPLIKGKKSHDSEDRGLWLKSAETFVLPFHSFEEGEEFSIKYSKKLPEYTLSFLWEVFYHSPQAGTASSYAADLLINKRAIYKQGKSLKNVIEIKSNNSKQLDDEGNNFEKLLKSNLSITAILNIDRRQKAKESLIGNLCSVSTSFFRFEETAILKDKKTICTRASLSNYWLDWVEIAQRADFDFNYLSELNPLEMRFYELTQLLRFKDRSKKIDELKDTPLKINYNELSNLMPLSKMKNLADAKAQIDELCRQHKKRNYIKNYHFTRIRKKSLHADVIVEFEFS